MALVRQYLNDDTQVPSDYDKLVAELEDIKEKYRTEHASAQALRDSILAAVERFESTEK